MKAKAKFEGRNEYENLEKQTICYCYCSLQKRIGFTKMRAANNGSFLFRQKYIVYYGNNLKGEIKEYGRNEDWI